MLLDAGGFAPNFRGDFQEFIGPRDANAFLQWNTWKKPRGTSMHYFFGVTAGYGGGGGFTRVAGANGGGGAGGASGCQFSILIPGIFLPDVLYLLLNAPGAGGAANTNGGLASGTYVIAVRPHTANVATNNLLNLINAHAGAAGAGLSTGGGTAGIAPTVLAMSANWPLAGAGFTFTIAGQAGTNGGGVAALGTALALPTTGLRVTGGIGGSGVTAADLAGQNITAITGGLISDMRPSQAPAGTAGSDGYFLRRPQAPFYGFGGHGGGSSNANPGLVGGNGAPGCGGGGGGAGMTGGRGGDGGPSFLQVFSW